MPPPLDGVSPPRPDSTCPIQPTGKPEAPSSDHRTPGPRGCRASEVVDRSEVLWAGGARTGGVADIGGLDELAPVLAPVAQRFNERGHRLYLVGGAVRDLVLAGRGVGHPVDLGFDLDMTTDARPDVIKELLSDGAEAVWAQGEKFGTIGARRQGHDLEVTTHRAEAYDPESRKPVVSFGDDLGEDLSRRDFTINAMAIELPGGELRDPHGGLVDLDAGSLRTPLSPEISFTDDPLRMLRAARFMTRFGLTPVPELVAAAEVLADRLDIVSVERVNDEVERLLAASDPSVGLEFLSSVGLLTRIVPELHGPGALAGVHDSVGTAVALASSPGSVLVRRAGLLWPIGGDFVSAVLRRLRYSNDDRNLTERLLDGAARVRDAPVAEVAAAPVARRLVVAVGLDQLDDLLTLLSNLARLDPAADGGRHRVLADAIDRLRSTEDLADLGSPLTGPEVMDAIGVGPGPLVGRAQRHLTAMRLDRGPLTKADGRELLVGWWSQRSSGT